MRSNGLGFRASEALGLRALGLRALRLRFLEFRASDGFRVSGLGFRLYLSIERPPWISLHQMTVA